MDSKFTVDGNRLFLSVLFSLVAALLSWYRSGLRFQRDFLLVILGDLLLQGIPIIGAMEQPKDAHKWNWVQWIL